MTALLNNEQQALQDLRSDIETMMQAVLTQLSKTQNMLEDLDKDLALEILHVEKKINSMELGIDKSCENILALYSPVAMDLRLTLAVQSIGNQLERIADYAADIAQLVKTGIFSTNFSKKTLEAVRLQLMFETAISMIDDAIYSFVNEDTKIAKWVFGKDQTLNQINKESVNVIAELCEKNPKYIKEYLHLFIIVKNLERVGDLAKNIAEETIFFVDAKIVKHKKKKKILKSLNQ